MPKGQPTPPEKIAEVQRLRAAGLSPDSIASETGLSTQLVSRLAPGKITGTRAAILRQLAHFNHPIELDQLDIRALGISHSRATGFLHELRKQGFVTLVEARNSGATGHHSSISRIEITARGRAIIHAAAKQPETPDKPQPGEPGAVRALSASKALGQVIRDHADHSGDAILMGEPSMRHVPGLGMVQSIPSSTVARELFDERIEHQLGEAIELIDQVLGDGPTLPADYHNGAPHPDVAPLVEAAREMVAYPLLASIQSRLDQVERARRRAELLEQAAALSDDDEGIDLLERAERARAVDLSPLEQEYLRYVEHHS